MKTPTNDYIIDGGLEGKKRLNVLSEVLYGYTRSLLEAQGVAEGTRLLDIGCGGGNVATMVAGMVGVTGNVTAIDFDADIIALNRQDAIDAGIGNIAYEALSAYDINYNEAYDVAYSRFLLWNLSGPVDVLRKMVRSVKPGGRIVVEDIQFSGHFCHPACGAFDSYLQYFTTAASHNGQDAEIGPSLPGLFREAGIGQVGFDVIQPAFSSGNGKWMAYITLDKIKDALMTYGIASAETVNRLLHELEAFTLDEQTIISLPRIFRVWGVRDRQ